ncbi:hypothetical protein FRE64_07450 [Euhalothece natronophila Z-M001]|uniref:Uncharacterized protein n=1 Tax=Euhalothece natronophila Z-M001 TaxID=522448 RepID=A0A5B8NMM8_9CHRO|nr:hypothetical protein [Euhalothece natronophila]QDZ39791.1 hypothetical protein FRE64_07450 [Euhalothece natronophila Z-M001]
MPTKNARPVRKTSHQNRNNVTYRSFPRYGGLTLEIGAKILTNALIIAVAIAALNRLLPHYQTQNARLEELNNEVERTQARVDRLNSQFTRNFDPYQSQEIRQEHTHQIKPNQRRIVWLEPETQNPE